jgi:hypothetical protein
MLRNHRNEQIRITATPPPTAEDESPERRTLLYLLNFVLTGVESVRTARMRTNSTSNGWLECWEDEEYTYLETRVAGDDSELELDLNVSHGVIFARIRRRRADSLADTTPRPDLFGRALDVPA